MKQFIIGPTLAVLVASSACTAGSANTPSHPVAASAGAMAESVDFHSSKWMRDRKVVNLSGDEVAVVSDLILDRGSGRIEYLVVKTGTTLGMGGRAIAVPYQSIRWESGGKDRFILDTTTEQLALLPEFTSDHWLAVNNPKGDPKNLLRQRLSADAATPCDPYAGNLDTASKAHLEGLITAVDRVSTTTFGEQIVITVRDAAGASHKVALGPSWYVSALPNAPMRGDTVVVDAMAMPRDPENLMVASKVQVDGKSVLLRDSVGHPTWALKTLEVAGATYTTPYSRYLLLSTLPGMKIDCRGNECGKVKDLVVDRTSGGIGFVSIDPNQNFLGIGDTERMIPWSVARVTVGGTMRIDASKEMVLSTIETPSDLSTLNDGAPGAQVYKAFDVRPPSFERAVAAAASPDGSNAWAARGPVASCIESNSTITMIGTVVEPTEVTFGKGVKSARGLKIRLAGADGGEELVLLGPAAYMDNQKPMCASGDTVTLEACRTTVAGQRYWIARNVTCRDNRVVFLESNSVPVWAQ